MSPPYGREDLGPEPAGLLELLHGLVISVPIVMVLDEVLCPFEDLVDGLDLGVRLAFELELVIGKVDDL